MRFTYLAALIMSVVGMSALDRKYTLAFWQDALRSAKVIATSVIVFVVWDILGISLGIFFSGESPYMSGLYLMPELPVEELFFLTFLCYFTLIMYLLAEKLWRRT